MEAARIILSRIAAEEEARMTREVRARFPGEAQTPSPDTLAPFSATLLSASRGEAVFVCRSDAVPALADCLIAQGATTVASARLDYVFHAENDLWRRLSARLRR